MKMKFFFLHLQLIVCVHNIHISFMVVSFSLTFQAPVCRAKTKPKKKCLKLCMHAYGCEGEIEMVNRNSNFTSSSSSASYIIFVCIAMLDCCVKSRKEGRFSYFFFLWLNNERNIHKCLFCKTTLKNFSVCVASLPGRIITYVHSN